MDLVISTQTYTKLIYLAGKTGNSHEVQKIFDDFDSTQMEPNIELYNAALYVYSTCGEYVKAAEILTKILTKGIEHDLETYIILLEQ